MTHGLKYTHYYANFCLSWLRKLLNGPYQINTCWVKINMHISANNKIAIKKSTQKNNNINNWFKFSTLLCVWLDEAGLKCCESYSLIGWLKSWSLQEYIYTVHCRLVCNTYIATYKYWYTTGSDQRTVKLHLAVSTQMRFCSRLSESHTQELSEVTIHNW